MSNTVGQAKARNDMRTCFSFCKLGTEKLSLVPLRNNSIVKLLLGQPAVGVNVKDIIGGTESQNFGVDPMTLPFLRFLRKQMCVTLDLPPRPSKFQTQARV